MPGCNVSWLGLIDHCYHIAYIEQVGIKKASALVDISGRWSQDVIIKL